MIPSSCVIGRSFGYNLIHQNISSKLRGIFKHYTKSSTANTIKITNTNTISNMSPASDRLKQTSSILSKSVEPQADAPFKVTVVGSGNWGTTIAKVVAENCALRPNLFVNRVDMWVFEENINGEKLTEIINTRHENVKYLPGIKLPSNLVANPDLVDAAKDADILVFNIPHQFLPRICSQLKGNVKPQARAISCLKGFDVGKDGVKLLSTYIKETLNIECGALSGANLAPEVAKENWSETTVAYQIPEDYKGPGKDVDHSLLKALFHRPYFHVNVIEDVAGISVAGALKNVIALGCGYVEGLGWGNNASAAIQRVGLSEMIKFGRTFFPECKVETYFQESAGVADLITTCAGGRNVRVAKHMAITGKSAEEAEKELLNGQSAQGIITTKEVHEWLATCGKTAEFPLFEAIYQITYGNASMEQIPDMIEDFEGIDYNAKKH